MEGREETFTASPVEMTLEGIQCFAIPVSERGAPQPLAAPHVPEGRGCPGVGLEAELKTVVLMRLGYMIFSIPGIGRDLKSGK